MTCDFCIWTYYHHHSRFRNMVWFRLQQQIRLLQICTFISKIHHDKLYVLYVCIYATWYIPDKIRMVQTIIKLLNSTYSTDIFNMHEPITKAYIPHLFALAHSNKFEYAQHTKLQYAVTYLTRQEWSYERCTHPKKKF